MDEKNNNHKKDKFTLAYIMSLPYTWMIFGYVIGILFWYLGKYYRINYRICI